MEGIKFINAIIVLVAVTGIAFVSVAIFSNMANSSLALEPGEKFYGAQRGQLSFVVKNLDWFIGGSSLLLSALGWLIVQGQHR
ncbi:hypothetical protein [Haloarchaeobius sp. HME9146]|uniref:hypothetical protein n=1 Tax=Haloarchaeobius sp. HME9146 TaxID=2978732 RepID=UPI0021BF395C|nr:hypothetical protein [Haloarchaeobius sp. HME9146]MCT9096877.1 hypothetical protein [Haloarchaeobius sp. HME9146]